MKIGGNSRCFDAVDFRDIVFGDLRGGKSSVGDQIVGYVSVGRIKHPGRVASLFIVALPIH